MAIAKGSLTYMKGTLEDRVYKMYPGNRVVVTKIPDMSNIVATQDQKDQRSLFQRAVAFAKLVNNDPELKKLHKKKVKSGHYVYQYLVKQYMKTKGKCADQILNGKY